MNKSLIFSLGGLLAGVSLAASTTYKLLVNGSNSSQNAIVVNSKLFVPLEVLEKAGVSSSLSGGVLTLNVPGIQGGANQQSSVEGCAGESLFNGLWRLRVTKVEAVNVEGLFAWGVTVELKNGSAKTRTVFQTGIDTGGKGVFLTLQSGNNISFIAVTRDVSDFGSKFAFASLPPGGAVVYQMRFYTDSGHANDRPAKFLLEIDPNSKLNTKDVVYSVKEPSFRVRLDCIK